MINFVDTLIKSNTLNFLVVLVVLLWIYSKLNISTKLENLRDEIKSFVNSSENEKNDADNHLKSLAAKIEKLPAVIERIENGAKRNIEGIIQKTKNDTQERINVIDNNASRIMDLETKKFKSKLVNLISSESVNLARENAIKQLDNNRDLHDKYIYEAIEEIGGVEL